MTTKVLQAIIGSAIIFVASLIIVVRNRRADDTFEVAAPPPTASLTDGMARLNVHTALLVQSLQIKAFPVWSPDARFLGVLLQGQWFKLDTSAVPLKEELWYEQRIGTTAGGMGLELMNANEAAGWAKIGQHGDKRVESYSGLKAEILDHDSSSMLAISKGALDSVIWKTNLENCGLLSLSPDGAYLAYECDRSGLFVTDVRRLTHGVASVN